MKLHKASWIECWAAALQILLGWKETYIKSYAKKTREKYPYDNKGFRCKKSDMDTNFEGIYLDELVRILKLARGWRVKFEPVKKKINVYNYVSSLKEGTWLIFTETDDEDYHVAVCQPGAVFDNQLCYSNGVNVDHYRFRDKRVLQVARLPDYEIKRVPPC